MGIRVPGQPATEDHFKPDHPNPRVASERAAQALLAQGVNVSVVRLSQIHNPHKQGLVSEAIELARKTGLSAYVGAGLNNWSAAHVSDTARLYRLALEKAAPGRRYHATAEGAIAFRDIAHAIGRKLDLPVESLPQAQAAGHFGWLMHFVSQDMSASSTWTRQALAWEPNGPGLIRDIEALGNTTDVR